MEEKENSNLNSFQELRFSTPNIQEEKSPKKEDYKKEKRNFKEKKFKKQKLGFKEGNEEIVQRMNFLYQASTLLELSILEENINSMQKKTDEALSRFYLSTMRGISKRNVIRM